MRCAVGRLLTTENLPYPKAFHQSHCSKQAKTCNPALGTCPTGDHALTALAIGRMLGIAGSGVVITGPEIDGTNDEALRHLVVGCNVFARASPENKLRIVRALQVGAVHVY